MTGTKRFFKFITGFEIFVSVNEEAVNITVPSYDVYNVKVLFSLVDSQGFSFQYDKYEFKYKNENYISKLNKHNNDVEKIRIIEIDEGEYINISLKKERIKLLKEPYKNRPKTLNFTYSFKDMGLKKLSEITKMNTWLDEKNDFAKVISILNWIDENFKHNGEEPIPKYRNSIELITLAKKNGGFLNCRGLAVLTNELLLSASLYSKFVICEQKEFHIDDYHVLNIVFINELNKWIMIDPSYNLYFRNNQNELLSVEEIRQHLIEGKDLIKNEEANYYGKKLSFELYKKSIVKKFYRFGAPINSSFNGDKKDNIVYLTPNMKDYNFQEIMDNPKVFWEKP